LFVYLVNKTGNTNNIKINISHHSIKTVKQLWELVGKNADDTKPLWRKPDKANNSNLQSVSGTSIKIIEYLLK
jgi:hypothetical protein